VTLLANGSKCRSLKTAKLCGESQIVMAKVDTGQKLSLQVDVTGNQVCVVFIVDGVIRRVKPVLGFGGNGETARYIMKTGYMTYAEKGIRRVHMAEFVASPLDDLEIPRTPDSPNPTGVGLVEVRIFHCGMPQTGGEPESVATPHFHEYNSWKDVPTNGESQYGVVPAPTHELQLIPGRPIREKFRKQNPGMFQPFQFTGAMQFAHFIFAYRDGGM